MNLEDFKTKIFQERPEVKKEYDALEAEYRMKRCDMKEEIHVRMISFEDTIGSEIVRSVALFDDRDLTVEEAAEFVENGIQDYRIVYMTQKQFDTVFRSLCPNTTEGGK